MEDSSVIKKEKIEINLSSFILFFLIFLQVELSAKFLIETEVHSNCVGTNYWVLSNFSFLLTFSMRAVEILCCRHRQGWVRGLLGKG